MCSFHFGLEPGTGWFLNPSDAGLAVKTVLSGGIIVGVAGMAVLSHWQFHGGGWGCSLQPCAHGLWSYWIRFMCADKL